MTTPANMKSSAKGKNKKTIGKAQRSDSFRNHGDCLGGYSERPVVAVGWLSVSCRLLRVVATRLRLCSRRALVEPPAFERRESIRNTFERRPEKEADTFGHASFRAEAFPCL